VAYYNTIDYITPQSTGNATDFGDMDNPKSQLAACSNSTRGVYGGGFNTSIYGASAYNTDYMGYITIASTGNSSGFGSLSSNRNSLKATASTTYGYFAGGGTTSGNYANAIDYITIASTGNGTDFGDLTEVSYGGGGGASSTRGIFAQSRTGGSLGEQNRIEYITFGTSGNATDFGNLSVERRDGGVSSSTTLCVFTGGRSNGGTFYNTIDKVTIASTGNATDFGDLINAPNVGAGASNGHGGLS